MMAGLYDRMNVTATSDPTLTINVHLIAEALSAYVGGTFTKNQIIDVVNEDLANMGSQQLRGEDLQDLDGIVDQIDLKATNTQKLIYGFCNMAPVFIAAERDLIPEAQWRGALGI